MKGAQQTEVVFPSDYWYDFHTVSLFEQGIVSVLAHAELLFELQASPVVEGMSRNVTVNSPLGEGRVPLFIRGGNVVPSFQYANTTTKDT